MQTKKIIIIITSIVLVLAVVLWIYLFPLQKARAGTALNEYLKKQGIPQSLIVKKTSLKDFKQGGYIFRIEFKDDPKIGYEYSYSKLHSGYYKNITLSGFKHNFGTGVDDSELKHQPISE